MAYSLLDRLQSRGTLPGWLEKPSTNCASQPELPEKLQRHQSSQLDAAALALEPEPGLPHAEEQRKDDEEAAEPPKKRARWSGRYPATPRSKPRLSGAGGGDDAELPPVTRSTSSGDCSICCNEAAPGELVQLRCGHGWYCLPCVSRYVETVLEAGAATVCCPVCRVDLPEIDLRAMLPNGTPLLDRLLTQSLEKAVCSSSDLRACPTPDCPMRVSVPLDELARESRFHCPVCKKTSCLQCGAQPFHTGHSCQEAQSARRKRDSLQGLQQWMEEVGAKQCPTCGMVVTKQNLSKQATQRAECHKMVCRCCSTRFCFKCLAILTNSFNCGCTADRHGFVDPLTGKFLHHLRGAAGA